MDSSRNCVTTRGACQAGQETYLAADHLQKLRGSGLTNETIAAARLYTERDSDKLSRLLGRTAASVVPALVFPFFDRSGKRTDYGVARPSKPRVIDGKAAKYEVPTGRGNRAYFPPGAVQAINSPTSLLLITEGILKALASTQAGVPCIGLMGVWNWPEKRESREHARQLIADLIALEWSGRPVAVVFDHDSKRNPAVHQAATELCYVLLEAGADARVLYLPPRNDACGIRLKQGLDDYIENVGADSYRRWIQGQFALPQVRSLDDWRREMAAARRASLSQSGVNLDRSQTGTGKSRVDVDTVPLLGDGGSLSLQPTHLNCAQVEADYRAQGIEARAYPPLNADTCQRFKEAEAVRQSGFPIGPILCRDCWFSEECIYLNRLKAAEQAQHAIATHKRGEVQMNTLMKERVYLSGHEDPVALLRPTYLLKDDQGHGAVNLTIAENIAREANRNSSSEPARLYYSRLEQIAGMLRDRLNGATETASIAPLPKPSSYRPRNPDGDLYRASLKCKGTFDGNALQLVRAIADGELLSLTVQVDHLPTPGGGTQTHRSLLGVLKTTIPTDRVIWFNDATANKDELEALLGCPVEDRTPRGTLERVHPCRQIPIDVTKGMSGESVTDILRSVMFEIPYKRIGVITHQKHYKRIPRLLGEPYSDRLSMVEYFRSGQSRGSNEWLEKCDALIVLGTPRVPPYAVRERLLQHGNNRAALMTPEEREWGDDYWLGRYESRSGGVVVRCSAYRDHDWHAAYKSLVQSELIQALGRGRTILREGIPVYVVSTENLIPGGGIDGYRGNRIPDWFVPLSESQKKVLATLYRERRQRVCRTSLEIAALVGISRQNAHKHLVELERVGFVRRLPQRMGWMATGPYFVTPC